MLAVGGGRDGNLVLDVVLPSGGEGFDREGRGAEGGGLEESRGEFCGGGGWGEEVGDEGTGVGRRDCEGGGGGEGEEERKDCLPSVAVVAPASGKVDGGGGGG